VCGELLSKGRQWVVAWRTTIRESVPGLGDSRGVACLGVVRANRKTGDCLRLTVLSAMVLAVWLN